MWSLCWVQSHGRECQIATSGFGAGRHVVLFQPLVFMAPCLGESFMCCVYRAVPIEVSFFNQLVKSCTWSRFNLRLSENCSSLFFLNPWLNRSQRGISRSQQKSTRLPSYALRSSLCNMGWCIDASFLPMSHHRSSKFQQSDLYTIVEVLTHFQIQPLR